MTQCDCSWDVGDYEPASVYRETNPQSRKQYVCCECGSTIEPGDRHQCITGLWDGTWDTFRTCATCARIRSEYCPHGAVFGGLAEALWECLEVEL